MSAIPSSGLLALVDKAVETRLPAAQAAVRKARARHPHGDLETLTKSLIGRTSADVARVAALSGTAAASPGVGTGAAVMATGADLAYTVTRLGELIMAIGIVHGHDPSSVAERREWVLTVLGGPKAARMPAEALVAEVETLRRTRALGVEQLNTRLGAKLAARLATRDGVAARLGRLLPFGIGAGVGAAANWMAARNVGRAAAAYFGTEVGGSATRGGAATPPPTDAEILDLDGEEIDPFTGRPL